LKTISKDRKREINVPWKKDYQNALIKEFTDNLLSGNEAWEE